MRYVIVQRGKVMDKNPILIQCIVGMIILSLISVSVIPLTIGNQGSERSNALCNEISVNDIVTGINDKRDLQKDIVTLQSGNSFFFLFYF
jgi:hypothetical protein